MKIKFIYREFDHLSVIHNTVQGFYYFSKHHNHILILSLVICYPRHSLDKISQKYKMRHAEGNKLHFNITVAVSQGSV